MTSTLYSNGQRNLAEINDGNYKSLDKNKNVFLTLMLKIWALKILKTLFFPAGD
jgi:hypothetical protein